MQNEARKYKVELSFLRSEASQTVNNFKPTVTSSADFPKFLFREGLNGGVSRRINNKLYFVMLNVARVNNFKTKYFRSEAFYNLKP